MPKTISIICDHCNRSFDRTIGEFNRSSVLYKKMFCSRNCANSATMKAVSVNCLNCNTIIKRLPSDLKKSKLSFCNRSCSASYFNKQKPKRIKQQVPCKFCKKLMSKHKSLYCESCKTQKTWTKFPNLEKMTFGDFLKKNSLRGTAHYANIRDHAKRKLANLPQQCQNCNYNKHVETCHIKAINTFKKTQTIGEINSLDNLILLCRNCHWELDHNLLTIPHSNCSTN